jgi:serine/threonine-protein kinase ULK/ATG1
MEHAPAVAHQTSYLTPFPVSRPVLRPLSTEGSVIPGETEEDGLLRREYVLVGDTQAVEFNQAVDG